MVQATPIKVMQINSMKIWRGGEVHVFLLCQQLISIGVSTVLACRSGSPIDQKAKDANIPVFNLPLKNTIDFKSAWMLADYCRKNSIDIIHAHNGRDYWLAGLAKFFNPKLKVVITRHILGPLKNTILHRWLYKKVDQVLAVSETVKNAITLIPPEKIAVVYNGIDTEEFAAAPAGTLRQELDLAATTKIVGMVGKVHPSKGHRTLLQSIPQILTECPDTVFIVVGSGDSVQLQQMNSDVLFLGERNNVPEIMKDLDVFVMASRNEPFGLVTLEAMAAGATIVGANSGGTAEIIVDGETGLLFPPDDSARLAQAVIRILTDSKFDGKLRENGSNAVHKYTIVNMAANTKKIYQDVLGRG
ncbi:MAG: hypothetical protein H6Q73_3951 [Firmicutes bacterium]|nr:hypothetical protein [Bacillota bacterium]